MYAPTRLTSILALTNAVQVNTALAFAFDSKEEEGISDFGKATKPPEVTTISLKPASHTRHQPWPCNCNISNLNYHTLFKLIVILLYVAMLLAILMGLMP